jgi:S-(hydroxymethyl)glutathione dehydrogenase/alcohol dehydrogenase
MLVHEKAVVKITDELPLEKAALLGCSVVTGVGAVQNTAKVGPGDIVAVVGCGGIGLNAIQGARIAGAERIIAVDRIAEKLDLARVFGATDTVNASDKDAVAEIIEMTGGGVDHAIEAVGLKQTAEQCFNMLGMGGTATVIGMIPIGTPIELQGVALLAERKIQGSVMGSTRFRIDMPMYANLYLQGRLKLDELVSRTLNLDQINDGFESLRKGDVARSIINF